MNTKFRSIRRPPTQNGCRMGAEYAIGVSNDKSICVAEITRYRQCANYIIRSQWADQYAIALIVPTINGEFRPNDFDSRSGARLMTNIHVESIQTLVGDQRPFIVSKSIFEASLKKLNQKEIVVPSIRSVGRNASFVRLDVKCRLPIVVPNT